MYDEKLKEFTKTYNQLADVYSDVFYDFVKMCAISIYNSFAKNQELEREYIRTINKYEKKYQELFPKMFGELIMMYEDSTEIRDILGPFYENMSLRNKHLGQCFTPSHISDLMSEMTLKSEDTLNKMIEEKGFITMSDPCCGAGRIDLIFCESFKKTTYKLSK